MKSSFRAFLLTCVCAASIAAPADAATVAHIEAAAAEDLVPAQVAIGGRATTAPDIAGWAWQWPGLYFETAFAGREAVFDVGPGATILHVHVDGRTAATLVKPAPGLYRLSGLGNGPHILRIQAATENQAGPNRFGGIFLPAGSQALPPPLRARRIEFVGDSHTVGYGNLSARRECSADEVWATTDNTRAYGPLLAARYGADYRVNAISGRGIVRNYGGLAADTLPLAYPWLLFDHSVRDNGDRDWQPHVVVIALGTNDFSTPLAPGERWKTREALHADYERGYVAFVQSLRQRYPDARFAIWATGAPGDEVREASSHVVDALRRAGETRVDFVPVEGLAMDGCDWHPSQADHRRIAGVLAGYLDRLQPWP
ncbi:SGNH/GDSL hydrolase family protein [Pseudoxanthomonas koreensis]|uniref:SGNH/GDSL hydrolase family protein n=1 Tax=Pseudoxanthomonas koreensis TaxID=266061 RepID=UPI0013909353|nr:SGNH/GDSL hydrolase family protein [Pseudoxanthomonas koreensis]